MESSSRPGCRRTPPSPRSSPVRAPATTATTQGGLFWFFGASNPEMLIKVLNACTNNNRFWVFFSAGTNVGFHVTVTDTKTGHVLSYVNPDLTPAPPLQDTSTLTCP